MLHSCKPLFLLHVILFFHTDLSLWQAITQAERAVQSTQAQEDAAGCTAR